MAERGVDRRVARTRMGLKKALFELISERPFKSITIQDITDRADVGRSTFYSHFASKEELLFHGFDQWLLSLTDHEPNEVPDDTAHGGAAHFRFSLPFLKHIHGQRRFFRMTIASGGSPRVRKRTVELLAEMIRRELRRMAAEPLLAPMPLARTRAVRRPDRAEDMRGEARVQLLAGAYMGLVDWWLGTAPRLGPEVIDQVFQEMAISRPR